MIDHAHQIVAHLIRGVIATGAILAAETASVVTSDDIISMLERLGLAVALVVFFVYTGWRREQRMGARIDKLEAKLAAQSTEALRVDAVNLAAALEILSKRTCYAFPNREAYERMLQMLDEYTKRSQAPA